LIRALSLIALLAYFLRASSCIDDNDICIDELIEHGEDFCYNSTSIILNTDCCDCEGGGSIATDDESFMFKLYAGITGLVIFLYEYAWVLLFHYNYNKKEEKRVRENIDQDRSNWYIIYINLTKVLQAMILCATFTIINIPFLGMYRPKYRQLEHCIRILISIAMGIMFVLWDDVIDNTSILIAMATVIPVHAIAYLIFDRAMSQQEDQVTFMPSYFKDTSSKFDFIKFKTDRLSVMPWRGKPLVGSTSSNISSEEIVQPNLILLGESTAELALRVTESKESNEDKEEVELQAAGTKTQVV